MSFQDTISRIPPVTKNLIIINVVIFLFMELMPGNRATAIDRYCALHYFASPDFNPAQLFTYMFLHAGFSHVFFNMFSLFMFGPQIEWSLGSKRFLFYYISCGLGAALVQMGVYAIIIAPYAHYFTPEQFKHIITEGADILSRHMNYTDPTAGKLNLLVNTPTVGASGAIYGVLLAFGMIFPNLKIMLLIPPMPIKAKWMVLGFGALELMLGLSGATDGIAHFCHLGGMLVGVLMILYWRKKGTIHRLY